MTDQHPINPPLELMVKWHKEACRDLYNGGTFFESKTLKYIVTQAARWGADQELEACCKWLEQGPYGFNVVANGVTDKIRADRRPKPLSLKEQALEALDSACYQPGSEFKQIDPSRLDTIRRALEQLND